MRQSRKFIELKGNRRLQDLFGTPRKAYEQENSIPTAGTGDIERKQFESDLQQGPLLNAYDQRRLEP